MFPDLPFRSDQSSPHLSPDYGRGPHTCADPCTDVQATDAGRARCSRNQTAADRSYCRRDDAGADRLRHARPVHHDRGSQNAKFQHAIEPKPILGLSRALGISISNATTPMRTGGSSCRLSRDMFRPCPTGWFNRRHSAATERRPRRCPRATAKTARHDEPQVGPGERYRIQHAADQRYLTDGILASRALPPARATQYRQRQPQHPRRPPSPQYCRSVGGGGSRSAHA